MKRILIALVAAALCVAVVGQGAKMSTKVVKSDKQWKKALTSEQYEILRKKGTETAYSGAYWDFHEKGTFVCAGCGLELFSSKNKFDSHTGWPSFYQPIRSSAIVKSVDKSGGMTRTEVACSRCGGHLGHVFDDGPKPTGLRFCINSPALKFKKG